MVQDRPDCYGTGQLPELGERAVAIAAAEEEQPVPRFVGHSSAPARPGGAGVAVRSRRPARPSSDDQPQRRPGTRRPAPGRRRRRCRAAQRGRGVQVRGRAAAPPMAASCPGVRSRARADGQTPTVAERQSSPVVWPAYRMNRRHRSTSSRAGSARPARRRRASRRSRSPVAKSYARVSAKRAPSLVKPWLIQSRPSGPRAAQLPYRGTGMAPLAGSWRQLFVGGVVGPQVVEEASIPPGRRRSPARRPAPRPRCARSGPAAPRPAAATRRRRGRRPTGRRTRQLPLRHDHRTGTRPPRRRPRSRCDPRAPPESGLPRETRSGASRSDRWRARPTARRTPTPSLNR